MIALGTAPYLVSIHAARDGAAFLGTGLVLNEAQVLTCRHVVEDLPNGMVSQTRTAPLLSAQDLGVRLHGAAVSAGGGAYSIQAVKLVQDAPGDSALSLILPAFTLAAQPDVLGAELLTPGSLGQASPDKIDLAVITLAQPVAGLHRARFLTGVTHSAWTRLRPTFSRGAIQGRGKGHIDLKALSLNSDFANGTLRQIQATGHGASEGYSGSAAICWVAQHELCFGIPFLGGDRAAFTRLISSDYVVLFLRALGIEPDTQDADIVAAAPWATFVGSDESGRYAEVELKGERHRLRWIPSGSMTSHDSGGLERGTAREVRLTSGFWLGETACTQAMWQAVMESSPSSVEERTLPVAGVSWDDCTKFLERTEQLCPGLSLRLPSEAEWEYAATQDPENLAPRAANLLFSGHGARPILPARSSEANRHGLFQMFGNVWEWCSDHYGPYTSTVAIDPQGPHQGAARVVRGGSHTCTPELASRRDNRPSHHREADLGFRIARDA